MSLTQVQNTIMTPILARTLFWSTIWSRLLQPLFATGSPIGTLLGIVKLDILRKSTLGLHLFVVGFQTWDEITFQCL